MFCANCGKEVTENMVFCANCGAKIERDQSEKTKIDLTKAAVESLKNEPNVIDVKIVNDKKGRRSAENKTDAADGSTKAESKKNKPVAVFKYSLIGFAVGLVFMIFGGRMMNVGIFVLAVLFFPLLISGIMLASNYDKKHEEKLLVERAKAEKELEKRVENKNSMLFSTAAVAGVVGLMFLKAFPVTLIKFNLIDLVKYGIGLRTKDIAGIPLASDSTMFFSVITGVLMLCVIAAAVSMLSAVLVLDPTDEKYSKKIHNFWSEAVYAFGFSAYLLLFAPGLIIDSFLDYHRSIDLIDRFTFKEPDSLMLYYGFFMFIMAFYAMIKDRKYKKVYIV